MSSRPLILALAVLAAACGETTPTQPSNPRPLFPILFFPVCASVGVELRCTVKQGDVDVTGSATWTVAASNSTDGLTPIDVAVVVAGRVVPVRAGNIAIHVRTANGHNHAQHTYAVDPAAPPITLAPSMRVVVTEANTGTPIEDATVEIIDGGVDTGRSAQTRADGNAFFEHLRMGVPFTYRTTKAGYVSATSATPPIADEPATGIPRPTDFSVVLQRGPSQ
jgi:hypothetical protein